MRVPRGELEARDPAHAVPIHGVQNRHTDFTCTRARAHTLTLTHTRTHTHTHTHLKGTSQSLFDPVGTGLIGVGVERGWMLRFKGGLHNELSG